MQAKLPDVNAQLIRHKNEAIDAYDEKDPIKASTHIDQIIALLPDEYKVLIDTDEYNKRAAARRLVECEECKNNYKPPKKVKTEDAEIITDSALKPYEFEYDSIQPYELLLSNIDSFITGQSSLIVWDCPKCGNTRPLDSTNKITEQIEQPVYYGVIPYPPKREGFHDRVGWLMRFWVWYDRAMMELNKKISLYRTEYATQQNALGADSIPFMDKEDEGDKP